MRKILYFFIGLLLFQNGYSCTSFAMITDSGVLIGKNRDYYYHVQHFGPVYPNNQFVNWYDNSYGRQNKFYALVSNNDVKMGINQFGLVAIEEDPIYPISSSRKYMQPINGNAEGMILYGILQNFATVDEIIPYIHDIFSVASPNFYQIADKNKILAVEVGFASNESDIIRPYTYHVISKVGESYAHTNTYLSPEFTNLNKLNGNQYVVSGADYRLKTIRSLMYGSENTGNDLFRIFLTTKSDELRSQDANWCKNTSIFRSYTKDIKHIRLDGNLDKKVYGTVSSMVVSWNDGKALLNLRMIYSLDTLKNGDQHIVYNELKIPVDSLFANAPLKYVKKSFIRKAPQNNKCL